MTRRHLSAYFQLALPFAVAVLCAVWMRLQQTPVPMAETLAPLLMLATAFAALVSINLDQSLPRWALTGMNVAALLFYYVTTVHPAKLLAIL